ncbi:MAG: hypothetical protein QM286_08995 [Acidobacteriota bacterium]|nr:hypothetical protein [Acidobacteriota bacterium]
MPWEGFEERLVAGLREVTDRVLLVVYSRSNEHAYVQFIGWESEVYAEASGFTPVSAEGAALLVAAGRMTPSVGQPNWESSLPTPALTSEYADLARRCVVALRDVFWVSGPDDLEYRAWREPEEAPPGVTWPLERFEELDKGENPLAIDALGIPPKTA